MLYLYPHVNSGLASGGDSAFGQDISQFYASKGALLFQIPLILGLVNENYTSAIC
jgi:hypothetical protein